MSKSDVLFDLIVCAMLAGALVRRLVSSFLVLTHSYVRLQGFWAKQFPSGPCRSVLGDGIQLHGMGDGALRRRSIKLLCAGWLPHSVFRPGAGPV